MSHACHGFWKCDKTLMFCSLLTRCTIPCACHAKRHLNLQKWFVHGVFCTFWLGNVLSRHSGVHFCDISTCKSGPTMVCFVHFHFEMCFAPQRRALFRHLNCQKLSEPLVCIVHFDLEMCFAPQRRALFRHLNCQKWSATLVFLTFWLGNVLRATTACNFSSLLWPAGSAPAALASLLFDPPETQIIEKTQWIATFLPFRASPSSFFLLFLFYSSLFWSFSSLCLCPALLFICPYCRKFDF